MFSNQEISEIKNLFSTKKNFVILTHYNADGDAIGSALGLKHSLRIFGVEATIVVPNDFPKFLKWMPEAKKIVIAEYKRKKALEAVQQAEVIFCLDFNGSGRISIVGEWLDKAKGITILIDHHEQPDKFNFMYSDTQQPATCQMVYLFMEALGKAKEITKEAAECLYTGIMTDTGGFRFRSTSALTHRIVADLIEKGADPSTISSETLDTNSVGRLKLLSLVLGRIEMIKNDQVAILWIKRAEMEAFGYEKGATEGFVNYGLSIAGSKMSAFFMEDMKKDFVKISFRSKDDLDVNQIARKYFNGGGHVNASGGKSDESIEETISRFKEIILKEEF